MIKWYIEASKQGNGTIRGFMRDVVAFAAMGAFIIALMLWMMGYIYG